MSSDISLSQGALERHHQTLKTILRAFCLEHERDWNKAVPYVMFAVREAPTESLGFSPNQLVFGHHVRGPLDVVRKAWCYPPISDSTVLLDYVLVARKRLRKAHDIARAHLGAAQKGMKWYYDRRTKYHSFQEGDEVLVLLPLQGQPLAARYCGPYTIQERVGDLDYLVATPDRRKPVQLCHVNMLKPYYRFSSQEGSFSFVKVEAVSRFPAPTCRRGLHKFLGVVGYYRRFVPGHSTLLAPLTDLLQKGRKWTWSPDCAAAFSRVKQLLCELPVLRAPDFKKLSITLSDIISFILFS
ncbi:uncharacterized protein LOC123509918 [Portunus trituberculatus]|uniref:uncharacterized protein LOC123509918 n=1 Tax=Portunus trituberculatus TaxID=210409 RepID=UPI001E1D177B|nr:uncharacterized protein LOC123509918 [Portunus trituberculatus]